MTPSSEKIPRLRKAPHATPDGLRIRLVVREDGAARFDTEVVPDGRDETVVIAQIRGESPLETVHRTVARVASFERTGRRIDSALLLISPRCDAECNASRRLLSLALLSHMAAGRHGELALCADEPDDELYDELVGLTDALSAEFDRQGVEVRLRLRGERSSPVASSPVAVASPDTVSDGAAA